MLKPEFCSIAAQLGSWDSGEGARPAGLRSPSPVALEGGFPPATPSTSASPAVICPKHLLPPAPPAAPVWPGPAEAAGAAVPLEQALWQRRLCGSPRARGRRRSPRAERCRSRRTGCLATSPGRRAIAEPGRSPPPPRPPFHSASALPATPGCPAPLAVPTAGAEAQGGGSVPHLRRPPGGRAGRWRPAGSALTPCLLLAAPGSPQRPPCRRCRVTRMFCVEVEAARGSSWRWRARSVPLCPWLEGSFAWLPCWSLAWAYVSDNW